MPTQKEILTTQRVMGGAVLPPSTVTVIQANETNLPTVPEMLQADETDPPAIPQLFEVNG